MVLLSSARGQLTDKNTGTTSNVRHHGNHHHPVVPPQTLRNEKPRIIPQGNKDERYYQAREARGVDFTLARLVRKVLALVV